MQKRKLSAVLVVLALLVLLAGCAPAKTVSTGAFNGNAYSNDFFGMTFSVPDGWYVASKEDLKTIFSATDETVGSDDKEAEKKMDLSKQKSLYLAFASLHGTDSTESNPNINLVVENLKLYGMLVKDGKAYAEAAMDDLKNTYDGFGMAYDIGEITSQKIGGQEYAAVDTTLTGDGFDMYQRMLCTVKNNYALVFTLTWFDDAELADLQKIVDSIEFK